MAEVTARKRGKTWSYRVELAPINGERQQKEKGGFKTKKEAIAAGTELMAKYNRTGDVFEPKNISCSDYLDYWLENYIKKQKSHNTYLDYESKVRLHIKPQFGAYRLSSIKARHIQEWIDNKKDQGYAKSMVKNMLACFQGALGYAVFPMEYIESNPCLYVKCGEIEEKEEQKEKNEYVCPDEEFKRIIKRFPVTSNFYLPLMIAYHLGTRLGETYGFDLIEDIDFKNHSISINRQMMKKNGQWCYAPPKMKSYRTIMMDSKIEKILLDEIDARKKNMNKYGEFYLKTYVQENNIIQLPASVKVPFKEVFPLSVRENGELFTTESFKYCSRVVHHELGNPLFHSHCLRHTHGTILAEGGASPKTVMERLGHKDIKVTMEKYVFNTAKMKTDAVAIFEEYIK